MSFFDFLRTPKPSVQAQNLLQQGQSLELQGEYVAAAAKYLEAFKLEPNNHQIKSTFERMRSALEMFNTAVKLEKSGKVLEAVRLCEQAYLLLNGTTQRLIGLGRQYIRSGFTTDAVRIFSTILRTTPTNWDAIYYMGLIACQQGNFRQGITQLEKATAHTRNKLESADTYGTIGAAYFMLNNIEQAIKYWEHTLTVDVDHLTANLSLGLAYLQDGRPASAIRCLKRAEFLDAEPYSEGSLYQIFITAAEHRLKTSPTAKLSHTDGVYGLIKMRIPFAWEFAWVDMEQGIVRGTGQF